MLFRSLIVNKQLIADKALDKEGKPIEVKAVATAIEIKEPQQKLDIGMSEEQKQAAHLAMKMLAGVCDGAHQLDGQGFNKLDTEFGHKLAACHDLSEKQAEWAVKLANKYRRQLPKELVAAILKA